LPLEVVDRNNFVAEFIHLRVQNPILHVVSGFRPQNEGEGEKLGAHFGIVVKPIPDFLIPVH